MKRYPIQVDLRGKQCVVIGAGAVAERKVVGLRDSGAAVRLVAPQAAPELQRLAEEGALTWQKDSYTISHLEGAFLVFAATNRPDVNALVARDAQARGLLVCRADEPDGGNFASPATVTRGGLTLTVSTAGGSPTLAAVLRRRLEAQFGPEWGDLTTLLGELRAQVQASGDEKARRAAVERVVDDPAVRDRLRAGNLSEAEARARECLSLSSE